MKRLIGIGILLFLTVMLAAASDIIGEIIFFEGEVTIYRNRREVEFIDFGEPIENFDQIVTGQTGRIEIAIYPETGIAVSITLQEDTIVNLDISGIANEQEGLLELLTGTLEVAMNRSGSLNKLNIRTGTAIMGGHEAEFAVQTTIAGDILLSVSEGLVECNAGYVLFATPGEAVEFFSSHRHWRNLSVTGDSLGRFRQNWFAERLASLAPLLAVQSIVGNYFNLKDQFLQAYIRLMNEREIIQKWLDEDRLGKMGSTSEHVREKRQIIEALRNIYEIQFPLELVFHRLHKILNQYPNMAGDTEVSSGLSLRNFIRQLEADSAGVSYRMAEIRHILKLYVLRNEGLNPLRSN